MFDYTLSKDFPLKQEQNEMIDFAIRRPYAVISGQTGLGKTYTAVTLATQLMLKNKDLITVVIAPPKALMSFEKELSEKLKVSYSIISTEKSTKVNSRFLLISNTCLEKSIPTLAELYKKYKILGIFDESHNGLQNPKSQMYKYFSQIR